MNSLQLIIMAIATITSIATALPGVFLVLRGMALMSDAISHAILPGIVIMFLLVQSLESPLLLIGASLAGIITVILTEHIVSSKKLKKDSAIGIVFPLFFSVGIIMISMYARNVHLDMDMVLLGELAFAPFHRLYIAGFDCGPYALWTMSIIACINTLVVYACCKELQISTFDTSFATVIGYQPRLFYYLLMVMTSITAVGSFNIVGSIVVVALMITPVATAYLLSTTLFEMIWMSILCSIASSMSGYTLAHVMNVSIAGAIAAMTGCFFVCALLFAPQKGLCASYFFYRTHRYRIAQTILRDFLLQQPSHQASIDTIVHMLNWHPSHLQKIIRYDAALFMQHNNLVYYRPE